jgi:glycosyltransferase involved in cell wall biosynthesis
VRILQLHNRQTAWGGADAILDHERDLLRSDGHRVEQFLVDNRETLASSSRASAGAKAVWNASAATDLDERITRFRPDVVHVHTPFPLMSPAVFRVASRRGVPTVATVHSFRYSCVKAVFNRDGRVCEDCLGRRLKTPAVRHRCYHGSYLGSAALVTSLAVHRAAGTFHRCVDAWIAPSEFMHRKLLAEGLPAARIVTKRYAIPDPGFDRARVGDHALFAGRLEPEKGIRALLDAWRLLRDGPLLTIVGDGSLRAEVEAEAAANDRITFKGWADQPTLRRELAAARFMILASEWYEAGFPVIAIQAFAAGTPIIASDVGNFSETIDPGVNGYLFRSGDPASLAAAVRTAWRGPRDSRLDEAARSHYVQEHSEERGRELLLGIYERVLRRRSCRVPATSLSA